MDEEGLTLEYEEIKKVLNYIYSRLAENERLHKTNCITDDYYQGQLDAYTYVGKRLMLVKK